MAQDQIDGTLYSWSAKRAGGAITITHSCGKISGIHEIEVENGRVIAWHKDGGRFALHVSDVQQRHQGGD